MTAARRSGSSQAGVYGGNRWSTRGGGSEKACAASPISRSAAVSRPGIGVGALPKRDADEFDEASSSPFGGQVVAYPSPQQGEGKPDAARRGRLARRKA